MNLGSPSKWTGTVLQAVLVILAVAAGVRVAWALLAPVVPGLMSTAIVLGIAWYIWRDRHQ
jgi:TRAP-type C4-dicarboxylate transport system permease large subunit